MSRVITFEEDEPKADEPKRTKLSNDEYFIKAFEVVQIEDKQSFRKRGVMLDISMFDFKRGSYVVQYSRTFKSGRITHIQFGSQENVKKIEDLENSEVKMSVKGERYIFNDFVVRITDTSLRVQSSVRKEIECVEEEETLVLGGEAA
jgi:hypothetical protein